MVTGFTISMKRRLELYGYKFIHLFRNVYLLRAEKVKNMEISIYGIAVLRKGE